jgi:signal transduction histidine kinase
MDLSSKVSSNGGVEAWFLLLATELQRRKPLLKSVGQDGARTIAGCHLSASSHHAQDAASECRARHRDPRQFGHPQAAAAGRSEVSETARERHGGRGAGLTQRLLAFARKQDLEIVAVDVVETVRGMASLLQSSVGSHIVIETRFPIHLDPVRTDGNQLELAILNLALNARDAMPDGGKIVIGATEEALADPNTQDLSAGDYVRIFVTDTGRGMETLARAVEPFYTTKGVGRGTGLGLPMVHGVAAQSGGRLTLKSVKGEGTTAEIWLPRDTSGRVSRPHGEWIGKPRSARRRKRGSCLS